MTIGEIANALGVSKSTVSRALSGKGRIGNATRERIKAYVAKTGIRSGGCYEGKNGNIDDKSADIEGKSADVKNEAVEKAFSKAEGLEEQRDESTAYGREDKGTEACGGKSPEKKGLEKKQEESPEKKFEKCMNAGLKENSYKKGLVKAGNIGVVIPEDAYTTSIPFFQECLLGISEAATAYGYNVIITTGTATHYFGVKQLVENHKVDGVILMRSSKPDLALEYLTSQGITVGLTGQCGNDKVIQVDSDNSGAARSLTSMLIDCGYRRFALIVGNASYRVNNERADGFFQALDRYGLKKEQQLYIQNFTLSGFMDTVMHDVLAKKIECIICGDDIICSRIMSGLQAEGYRIPLDIAIASLYNGAALDCFTPAVTAVNILARQLGVTVGNQVIHCLRGEAYNKKTILDYEILFRKSAGRTF